MWRRSVMAGGGRRLAAVASCCCLVIILPSATVSDALLLLKPPLAANTLERTCRIIHDIRQMPPLPTPRSSSSSTALEMFYSDGGNNNNNNNNRQTSPSPKRNNNVNILTGKAGSSSRGGGINGVDIMKTLELKDEALLQAQTAVSSLESALESAVSNLESMQQQLQVQVVQLEQELENTRLELGSTQSELDRTKSELTKTREELVRSREESDRLQQALAKSEETAKRADQLEAYVATLKENMEVATAAAPPAPAEKKERTASNSNQWQLFSSSPFVIPVLNDWIAIKGTGEGEIQISGKVTNHPSIPDGDAIVTSPLTDPGKAAEKKIVTTLSGSKYRLGTPMTMPSGESASQKITSSGKEKKSPSRQLIKARSSISIPDLTGNTLGNGRYLLAGEATSSINGRSFIQTAYRASPLGKPMGEPLAIKFSQNKEAMKREYANYQKVSSGLKRGSFIRRVEFLPVAGDEMPDKSALVMQRGAADVKAFMPKVGGRLEGELLVDCAMTALRCAEALHSSGLVWNDLKTENFVAVEEAGGGVSFRGIDLESCMPRGKAPVDYTPEACPPEFARSFLEGDAESFRLEFSYDVWSFGMFLYEISTGRGFFDGYSAEKITKSLPSFEPNINRVEDPVLADLISQCLLRNPKERPSIVQILKHPFFADVAIAKTPFDFLFGM